MTKKLSFILLSVLVSLSLLVGTALAVPGKAQSDKGKSAVKTEEKVYKANPNAKALEKAKGVPMQFSDTENHWSDGYVKKAQSLGLVNGYEDGTFQPDAPLTEVETMVIAVRLAELLETDAVIGTETDEDSLFEDDVEADEDSVDLLVEDEELGDVPGWAKNAAKKAAKLKIVNLNFLNSDVQATRVQAAVEIAIAAGLTPVTIDTTLFKDAELIPVEALGYLQALKNNNYIQGDSEGNFVPDNPITRAEIAAILARIAKSVDDGTVDDGTVDDGTVDGRTIDDGTTN